MTQNQVFDTLIEKLKCSNRNVQYGAIKDIAAVIQNANKRDLLVLLHLLQTLDDVHLQVKLFSILAAYLLSNESNSDVIISCKPLYDTVQEVLKRGLPLKTTATLNFVVALLSFDEEGNMLTNKKSLAMYARNMLRVSGCLMTMCDLFTSTMMYQDTWIALCNCLAESCRCSEVNQSYCSHLVPLCVQRCKQGSTEVCMVLLSLLHNHNRNIQLFLANTGISIFTREMLQYDIYMQLLNSIVQKSAEAVSLLSETNVINNLQETLRLYGPYSQMGQWSTIILYHLDSRTREVNMTKNTFVDLAHNPPENLPKNVSAVMPNSLIEPNNNSCKPDNDGTMNLFQNVIREVIHWKSQNNDGFKRPNLPNNNNDNYQRNKSLHRNGVDWNSSQRNTTRAPTAKVARPEKKSSLMKFGNINSDLDKDLSFTFLLNNFPRKYSNKNKEHQKPALSGYQKLSVAKDNKTHTQTSDIQMHDTASHSDDEASDLNTTKTEDKHSFIQIEDFKPPFVSTPKSQTKTQLPVTRNTEYTHSISRSLLERSSKYKISQQKKKKLSPSVQQTKHKSMSARLFSAINDSCTTFVKSFKYIFRPNKNPSIQQQKDSNNSKEELTAENGTCSYSFTNYMRKRDALMDNESTKTENNKHDYSTGNKVNSCKTCNDTIALKNKLADDEYLKKTIQKLKLGINLYGCNFKRISRTMWPREKYMTPKVLNSLYRKLIAKQHI